jgi:phosphorylase/glycogen(starch) synthase
LIENISVEHWKTLEENKDFVQRLKTVEQRFDQYMEVAKHRNGKKIAYFSMEYGLDNTLKIFSGGLGMLAGDYLKEASDNNIDIVGIGLLYRYGYFKQSLNELGEQVAEYISQQFNHLPVFPEKDENGERVKVSLAFPGRTLTANVWRIDVGRIPLYLLDAHIPENTPEDQSVTDQLYGGSTENRLKQELLLGVGGIRMLNKLGITPDLYHCNEGHAAFIGIERINNLIMKHKFTFAQAKEVVRSSSLFTTHTPVPAGHDYFTEDMLRTYIPHYADRLTISWNDFINLGRFKENNLSEKFSMSVLAINLSQEVNGVSKIHGRVSREMFAPMFLGYYPEEIHIGHVTNGVHFPTWASRRWQELYNQYFDKNFLTD